jgi:hypothetical protein
MSEYTSEVGRIADAVNDDGGGDGVDRSGVVSDNYSSGGDDGVDRSGVVSDDFSSGDASDASPDDVDRSGTVSDDFNSGGPSGGGSSGGGSVDRSGVVDDDFNSGGPSTRTVSGETSIPGVVSDDFNSGGQPLGDPISERDFARSSTPPTIDDETAQQAAEQIEGVGASMIQDVEQTDGGRANVEFTATGRRYRAAEQLNVSPTVIQSADADGVTFVDAERERRAREQFTQQRPDSQFDANELNFEATDDGVDVSVRDSAIERRRAELDEEEEEEEDLASALDVDETTEPGAIAQGFDALTDGFERVNPGIVAGIGVTATSLRTDSGIGPLPGGDDIDTIRDAAAGPREDIDAGIATAVEAASIGGNRGVQADDLPSIGTDTALDIASRDLGLGAAATVVGTEFGRDAATEGITDGLQSFNPAAVVSDTATVADVGVRGTDRVLDADADEVQTGLDTADAIGEFAVDEGPALATAGVARNPSSLISVPIAGATIASAGIATGTAAAGAARTAGRVGRSGGRVARSALDDLDASRARRFVEDDRGQLDGAFRRQEDAEDITITAEDIEPGRGEPTVRRDDGPDIDAADPIQRRRERARRSDDPGDRSRDLAFRRFMGSDERLPGDAPDPDFSGLTSATRQGDDVGGFGVPRDPLDTRGGRLPGTTAGETAGIGIGTGAATTGLLADLEADDSLTALDQDSATLPALGTDTITGLSEDAISETEIGLDTDTGTGSGSRGGARPVPMELLSGQTSVGVQQAQAQTTQQAIDEFEASAERTPGRTVRQTGSRRSPPRLPELPAEDVAEFEGPEFGIGFDDAVFETPTRTLGEADDLVVEIGELGER